MEGKILDGRALSQEILNEIRDQVIQFTQQGKRPPGLGLIMVGNNPASESYVRNKIKSCDYVGFASKNIHLDENISQEELLQQVQNLNTDDTIDGFIVQLPLPKTLQVDQVIAAIDPEKDVDGFNPINVGNVTLGQEAFISATPNGIIEMLNRYNIETQGKRALVIGRSNIVGRPISILLSSSREGGNATVTLAHRYTKNLKQLCLESDIIVVAVGQPNLLTGDMVKEGVVVIDVGINRIESPTKKQRFQLVGDVDFQSVYPKCSAITPVPGGVGPMTVCSLIMNTLKSYKNRENL